MNVPRRIAALKREIVYRERELDRIATLQTLNNPAILATPQDVEKYLADIRIGIAQREVVIQSLESRFTLSSD
jgi:hypothetical protein